MSYNNNWVKQLRESYIEEKKATDALKKGAKAVAKGAKKVGKIGKRVVDALGTPSDSFQATHLGPRGFYDHIEHDGEQLDELSKATYGSYIKKAAKDMQDRAYDATPIAGDEQHAKIAKRVKGIGRAVKALGKESTRSEEVEHEGNSLQEEMALNEDLLMLIGVLCEELGIDVDELMEVTAFTDAERRSNPDILGMERHQLGRLRNLADRVNQGKAKLNNPTRAGRRLAESEQLDEAGYKRLMRLKKAAYAAQDKAHRSFTADQNKPAKLARAAAEREAQVAAGMARRGGASQEAVRGGGSRIGKSGKYTQKAGKLANQRDKALASFRTKGRIAQLLDKREDQSRKKRERQQAQAKFNMDARHGYFGHEIAPEIAKAGMRARYNYEKKYGRLKGK